MIWQLMKLDPAWMWTAILSLVSIFFCALGGSFIVSALLLFGCGVIATQSIEAGFYTALPVTSRQVYLERTLAVNVLLWLPLAINGQVFMLGPHGDASGGSVIAIGSILMLALQAILAAKFGGWSAPGWPVGIPFIAWLVFSTLPKLPEFTPWQSWLLRQAERTPVTVVMTCWLLTGILFARGVAATDWFVPEQAQPAAQPTRGSVSRFSYITQIFITSSYLWIVYLPVAVLMGLRLEDDLSLAAFIWLIGFGDAIGRKFRWMSCLPVSPRALLAGILSPALAAIAAGYEIGLRIPIARLPLLRDLARTGAPGLPALRDQVASVIIVAAALMMMTLMLMAQNWKTFGGRIALWLVPMVPSVYLLADGPRVAASLPAGLPALIAVGMIAIGLLYWALDTAFRQLEFIDKPAPGEDA